MAKRGALVVAVAALFIYAAAKDVIPGEAVSQFLVDHGLPGGLLPAGVVDYHISDNGDFKVYLDRACYAHFDHLVWYDKVITGTLLPGKIKNLSGVQAQELFLWFSVTGLYVSASNVDSIFFEVGPITRQLPLAQFYSPPACKSKALSGYFYEDVVVEDPIA